MTRQDAQRRTLRTLMVSNVFGYAGFISVAAVAGLLSAEMLGSDTLAGVPGAAATIGTAIAASPLALRSRRKGRRRGLWFGYVLGLTGAAAGFIAGQAGLFWLFVAAMVVFGVGNTANLQNRFAAADLAEEDRRAQAIALVLWMGTIGAVVGSPTAIWVNRVGTGLGLGEWVAPLLVGVLGFTIAGAITASFLRPDPLELVGGTDPDAPLVNPIRGAGQSWRVIWPNSRARLAIISMAVSQMAMVAVMVMTPLQMRDHGQAELSTIVIAVHVLGMFGLSPLIGRWADRFGRIALIRVGALILGTGTVAAVVAGYSPPLMFVGLFMLGLGWSFAVISGSALLTESLPVEERLGAQGMSDVMMSLLGAAAAFFSGFVKAGVGYHWLANFATIAAALILIAALRVQQQPAYEPAA